MNRPLLLVSLLGAVLLGCLGVCWVHVPPSNQELLANAAKAMDYAEGWKSVGGPAWWTPNFLQGTSLAPLVSHAITSLWLLGWIAVAGLFTGPKIGGLACLFIGLLGFYAMARRLTQNSWAAAACAAAFLLTPSLYVRLGGVEHMVFISAFAVIPWLLLGLVLVVEKPTRLNGLLFGTLLALLLLTYAKAAALLLPMLVLAGISLWLWKQRTWRIPSGPLLMAGAAIFVLGILPNLPAVREIRQDTIFELAPFEGWQNAFSLKSNLLWLDRDGILSRGISDVFAPTTAHGGNYLGLVPAFLLAFVLWRRWPGLYSSGIGFICRLAIGLALVAHWLSFGMHSIVAGQLEFLRLSVTGNNISVPIAWVLFLIQPWIISRLLPLQLAGRGWWVGGLSAIYLLVPGFRLIAWLPIYSDLRAPHDFSQVIGVIFVALASGCAAFLILDAIPTRKSRIRRTALAVTIAVMDIFPFFQPFLESPLDRTTFDDFQAAEKFLAQAPREGWVHPVSGRYFYLLTPHLSHRGLTSEAFNAYLMQRRMAFLQATAQISPSLLPAYLNAGGVAYVLIDKNDPDSGLDIQNRFRTILPTAFENENFLVLENPGAMAPAFLAQNFISGHADLAHTCFAGLVLEKLGIIALPDASGTATGKLGDLTADGYKLDDNFKKETAQPFTPLSLLAPRWKDYQTIAIAAPQKTGWIVIPEAYHRDWQAFAGDKSLPIIPADGGLMAVAVAQPDQPLILRFMPPWWYNAALAVAVCGWLATGGIFLSLRGSLTPRGWRDWWLSIPTPLQPPPIALSREAIRRVLIVIPTYNELHNLPSLLEKLLPLDERIEILIVDDNSPDGTGEAVKQQAAFGQRLHLLSRAAKLGLGSAYREGFQWAFQQGFDACLEMDADFSHDPADIPRLLEALDLGADAAIGSRYLGGVRVMNWPEHRLWLSTGAARFVRWATGLPLTDATSGFKALRISMLQKLDWTKVRAQGYGFQVELHYYLWRAGARLVEIPIVFTERRSGETKMTLGIALEAGLRTLQLAFSRRPLPPSSDS